MFRNRVRSRSRLARHLGWNGARPVRIQPYLAADNAEWFVGYRAGLGLSESDAVNAIFRLFRDQEKQQAGDRSLLFKRLDRITSTLDKILLVLNLLGECLRFVFRFIFGFMADVSADERVKRQEASAARVEELVRFVVGRFDRGERFLDDMAEKLAKDANSREVDASENATGNGSGTGTSTAKDGSS